MGVDVASRTRRRAAMIGGGLAVAVLGVGGALALGAFDRKPPARDAAPTPLAKPDPSTLPSLAEKAPAPEPHLAAHDGVPADELAYRRETGEMHRGDAKPDDTRTAGILGTTALHGPVASLTGTGDLSSGFDDTNIDGGLMGDANDPDSGFGIRSGGGGTGRYGTIGRGGSGSGRGATHGHSAVPTVSIGQPSAAGDLDKAIIRRYVKRNISKISYCYEKQLLDKPGIKGTIATQFFIDAEGHVASATASGVDPDVASCVAGVIKTIEFPKPKGGGAVRVTYPFVFQPAGS
jgi:hypothetical protein